MDQTVGRIEQIADNVFSFVENRGSNDSMVVTEEGIVLIDVPYAPTDALKWRRFVEEKGEIRYIVNTDHHIDHILGNSFLPGISIAHELTRQKMVNGGDYWCRDFVRDRIGTVDPEGLPLIENLVWRLPDITLNDRMTLHLGGLTFEIMHFKGHTANELMVYLPEQKILFSGDNVCEGVIPSVQEPTILHLFRTLKHFMTLDIEVIVPGHGKPCGKDQIHRFYAQMEELVDRVRTAMRRGMSRAEIAEAIRYQDKIRTGTAWIEHMQRKSMGNIYDALAAEGGAATEK